MGRLRFISDSATTSRAEALEPLGQENGAADLGGILQMFVLSFAEDEPLASSLEQVTRLLAPETQILKLEGLVRDSPCLPRNASGAERVSWFTTISERLEEIGEEKLRRTVMVAATSDATESTQSDIHPLLAHCNGNLLAWLVLAFPECHWEILTRDNVSDFLVRLAETLFLASAEAAALFDPRGRRAELCQCLVDEGIHPHEGSCVVLEDEVSHAWLNAYAGYRFGRYRVWTVTRWALASHLMEKRLGPEPDAVIEDVYLRFPDARRDIHLSNLECRDSEYFNLPRDPDSSPLRLVISGGYGGESFWRSCRAKDGDTHLDDPRDTEKRNRNYIKSLKRRGAWLEKPVAGLFALREPIQRHLRRPVRTELSDEPEKGGLNSGHAAPGRLTMIADRLVNRSARLLQRAVSVPDAIHAAVLAHDTKELLAARTPTLAIKALAHQHQAEVVAESMFFGVSANIRVRERQRELEAELKRIFPSDGVAGFVRRWFRSLREAVQQVSGRRYRWVGEGWRILLKKLKGDIKRRRDAAALINEALARQFARFGKFDEEQRSLGAARANRFRFGYLRIVLRSPLNLVVAVLIGWTVFAGAWYGFLRQVGVQLSFLDSLIHSTLWSLSGESPEHFNNVILNFDPTYELWDLWRGLLLAETIWSFVHLALAVALIVSHLTRR